MRGRLLTAVLVAACALAALIYLAGTSSAPTLSTVDAWEENTETIVTQPTAAPTQIGRAHV